MEIPIVPILIGGVVIMSIISWAEDNLKDDKKKTLKYWNKDSPLRRAFKTVADFQYSIDLSESENNRKLRDFHRNAQTVAKTILKTKYKGKVKPQVDNAYSQLRKDLSGMKDKNEILKTVNEYVAKVNGILPDNTSSPSRARESRTRAKPRRARVSRTRASGPRPSRARASRSRASRPRTSRARASRSRAKPQGILKNKKNKNESWGFIKDSISEDSVSANSVSTNSVSENSVSAPAPVRKVSFGSKRRKHKRSKKRSNKKSKKRSNKKSKKRSKRR